MSLVTFALATAGIYGAGVWLLQRSVLFPCPAPASDRFDPGSHSWADGIERLWLGATSEAEAVYMPPLEAGKGPAPLVIFAHGNGEVVDDWLIDFQIPRRWGMGVLLVEYPGYGRSQGKPTQASIAAVMRDAFDKMAARAEVDDHRIVGYGRSLGGGAVCTLASQRDVAALILESTFTSTRPLAARFAVPGFLVRDPFDNAEVLSDLERAVLVLHGSEDKLVPIHHAHQLHATARDAHLEVFECGHSDCPRPWLQIRSFLTERSIIDASETDTRRKVS